MSPKDDNLESPFRPGSRVKKEHSHNVLEERTTKSKIKDKRKEKEKKRKSRDGDSLDGVRIIDEDDADQPGTKSTMRCSAAGSARADRYSCTVYGQSVTYS